MKRRVRISIKPHDDPTLELEIAHKLRQHICIKSPDGFKHDDIALATKRTKDQVAYFELETLYFNQLGEVIISPAYMHDVNVEEIVEMKGDLCERCDRSLGEPPATVCKFCGWRDTSACPFCHAEVSRQRYVKIARGVDRCPKCGHAVHLRFRSGQDTAAVGNTPRVVVEKTGEAQ